MMKTLKCQALPPAVVSVFVASAAECDFQLAATCVSDAPPAQIEVRGHIGSLYGSSEVRGQRSADLYLQVSVGQQGVALLLVQSVDVSHQTVVVVPQLLHLLAQPLPLLPNLLHALS